MVLKASLVQIWRGSRERRGRVLQIQFDVAMESLGKESTKWIGEKEMRKSVGMKSLGQKTSLEEEEEKSEAMESLEEDSREWIREEEMWKSATMERRGGVGYKSSLRDEKEKSVAMEILEVEEEKSAAMQKDGRGWKA